MLDDALSTPERLIYQALTVWANWIETGEVYLSATDAANCGKPCKPLSADQHALVARLRDLATQCLQCVPEQLFVSPSTFETVARLASESRPPGSRLQTAARHRR